LKSKALMELVFGTVTALAPFAFVILITKKLP